MSQRKSGYKRQKLDDYQTRESWVTEALIPALPEHWWYQQPAVVWEPAAGEGFMVRALRGSGFKVFATDISRLGKKDFLKLRKPPGMLPRRIDAIITNPPYSHATEFIEHALKLAHHRAFVCMLLRCDFDSAKSRQHLFGGCEQFACKLVLTKRINWFEHRIASPSFNHAWYIWDKAHRGSAEIKYHYEEQHR